MNETPTQAIAKSLAAPFAANEVHLKPGAVSGNRALWGPPAHGAAGAAALLSFCAPRCPLKGQKRDGLWSLMGLPEPRFRDERNHGSAVTGTTVPRQRGLTGTTVPRQNKAFFIAPAPADGRGKSTGRAASCRV